MFISMWSGELDQKQQNFEDQNCEPDNEKGLTSHQHKIDYIQTKVD